MSTLEHALLTSATAATGTALIALGALTVSGVPDGIDPSSALLLVATASFVLLLVGTVLLAGACVVRGRPYVPLPVWAWVGALVLLPVGAAAVL